METSLSVAERPRRPEWMKVRAPSANTRFFDVKKLIHGASLHTICEEARCPNIAECWGRGTATFQILGDTCTRACRYCYVHSGTPEAVDPLEPLRLAQTAAQMGLEHVVVTSVDRDDLPDRGAGHYAATIRALKHKLPQATVEVLTPDFLDVEEEALETVLGARPDVFNHNIETVRRLHRRMRGAKGNYDGSLALLARAKELADYPILTKSGIIVGLGESNDEVVETMRDLRAVDVDVVTIGQYLQPSPKHAAIDRWVHPDEFRFFREQGEALGFGSVFSGPLVRSSYRADELAVEAVGRRRRELEVRVAAGRCDVRHAAAVVRVVRLLVEVAGRADADHAVQPAGRFDDAAGLAEDLAELVDVREVEVVVPERGHDRDAAVARVVGG